MRQRKGFELPPDKARAMARARRLEWWTVLYLLSATIVVALVLGQSQAMKTAWLDDVLGFIPVIVFLIGSRVALWEPNPKFPYGYHRATSAAYLGASAALFAVGLYLFIESALKLVNREHPTIGTLELFGHSIWLGWLMIAALLYSAIPAMILGRMKLPVAEALYDKVLHTDAKMNKADWLTELAAIVGILGIGYGLWWADAVAAIVISFEILRDGYTNLHTSVLDLIDRRPQRIGRSGPDPIVERIHAKLKELGWIKEADVRLRVNGHTLFGEAFVVPTTQDDLVGKIERAVREVRDLDWRLHDFTMTPVSRLAPEIEEKTD